MGRLLCSVSDRSHHARPYLNVVSPSRLDGCKDFVMRQARHYGDLVWPILYQSDVRARLELVERIRRDAAFEKPRGFDSLRASRGRGATPPSPPGTYADV
eukprot:879053-Amphidinium_carterae.1